MKAKLGVGARKKIEEAVDLLFEKAKHRVLGYHSIPKFLKVAFDFDLSLPGIFTAAAQEEYNNPDQEILKSLLSIAAGYIDSIKESTKSKVVKSVQDFLTNAEITGVKTDLDTVLGGQLVDVWKEATSNMYRIINTEANAFKNTSILDSITKIAAANNEEDPYVYFAAPYDSNTCKTCLRLHFLNETSTPRVWKLSELKQGYQKKDDLNPSVLGGHPNCRGTLVYLSKGYGFKKSKLGYINPDHDELRKQRNEEETKN